MRELTKSAIFVVAAVIVVAVAAWSRPEPIVVVKESAGDKVFSDFTEVSDVAQLQLVRYNAADDDVERLEIASEEGQWVVASHQNYPADAEDAEQRIRQAAIDLMDLEIIDIANAEDTQDKAAERALYGVVEPEDDQIQRGLEGVGMLVTVKNAAGNKLAELIVGKPVKGLDGARFARRPGEDRIYVVKINPDALSPNLEDWIQADLLELNPFDIQELVLRDYSVDQQLAISGDQLVALPQLQQRFELAVRWNQEQGRWTLQRFRENRGGRGLTESKLLESEQLNTDNLNQVKNAVGDLKIVDVVAKPAGVTADLKAEKSITDNVELLQSLMKHGFFPAPGSGEQLELYSSDGELRVTTTNAVQYVLRFGRAAGVEEREGETMLNRYLLVSARVDEQALAQPELTELPPEEGGDAASQPASQDGQQSPTAEDAGDQAEPAPDDAQSAAAPEPESAADEQSAEESARAAIEKENQRKLDEYKERRRTAEERVKELNDRFAQWYYIIPEDIYKQIHLNRFDLITEKDSSGTSTDLEEFRSLRESGLAPGTPE